MFWTKVFLSSLFISSFAFAGAREAQQTAETHPLCKKIQPFYWEVGNDQGHLHGGSVGKGLNRNSEMKIASASKFVFAAYLLEKVQGSLSEKDKSLLLMQGGFDSFNPLPCALRRTVKACFAARNNSHVEPSAVNRFYYSGGNAQALAILHGLGDMNKRDLNREVETKLKNKFPVSYANLALAGGLETTPEHYATFLQETLRGTYRLKDMLGANTVCTFPQICKAAVFSPAEENWQYSYHHWVETNAQSQVEAYSSPGARGFYPWISQDKKTYGILARDSGENKAYWSSVLCGREIRRAYFKK